MTLGVLCLFAQISEYSGRGWPPASERPNSLAELAWAAVGVAILCLGMWLVRRALRGNSNGSYHSRAQLFQSLCKAHRLTWAERRLLRRLAQARGLGDPTILFVEPGHFVMSPLPSAVARHTDRLSALQQRLFGA
jgi:hypothetical protein